MERTLVMRLLPALGALVLAFGLVSSVEAAAAPARAAAPSHALEASPNASTAGSLMRHDANTTKPASTSPAQACRRVAAAAPAPAHLVERCRNWLQSLDEDTPAGIAVCRRIAAAEGVGAPLVERCREILGDLERERPERERPQRERPERTERERPERPRSEVRSIQPAGRVTR